MCTDAFSICYYLHSFFLLGYNSGIYISCKHVHWMITRLQILQHRNKMKSGHYASSSNDQLQLDHVQQIIPRGQSSFLSTEITTFNKCFIHFYVSHSIHCQTSNYTFTCHYHSQFFLLQIGYNCK